MTMTKELLELLQSDIYTDAPEYAERVAKIRELITGTNTFATDEEIEQAREDYARHSSNNIEIDEGAQSSRADDGVWVQAWVWLQDSDLDSNGKSRGERDARPVLTDQDWRGVRRALTAKLKSPVTQGESEWRAHLRRIKTDIIGGFTNFADRDWEEIYYALIDCDGEQSLVEKIGPDGNNMCSR